MSDTASLKIATRASPLALWQAKYVADLLRTNDPECVVELVEVSTHGDRDRREPLSQMGGLGVFTREVQNAVLDGRADLAVHSLKDLPTVPASGLTLAGVPQRAARFDVLVGPVSQDESQEQSATTIDTLRPAASIGTGSLRRQAQLLHHRPDLVMAEIRGNVETRLQQLDDGAFDAIVLAQAGLERLGLTSGRPLTVLEPPLMLPAVGQAALGLECRDDDESTIARLARLSHRRSLLEVTAERACLLALHAGCHAPVGLLSRIADDQLSLEGVVLSADGRTRLHAQVDGPLTTAEALGRDLAAALVAQGASALIDPS